LIGLLFVGEAFETAQIAPFSFGVCFLKRSCEGRMHAKLTRNPMKNLARYLGLAAKLLIFLLVLGFALKNSHPAIFYAYLGASWQAPLIIMLGLAVVLGVLLGVLALLPTVFRLRREALSQARDANTLARPHFPAG
jgi:uncharacterized integral membrane protein